METLRNYLETIFGALPKTQAAQSLKAEMLANMEEKFQDLVRQGKNEAEAIGKIISEFGTVEELRAALEAEESHAQYKRKKGVNIHDAETGDHVHIGWDGIHVRDHHGDNVRVGFSGVHVEKNPDDDGVEEVYVDKHGVYVKKSDGSEKYIKREHESKAYNILSGILFPLAIIVYLCLGFFYNMWHPYWLILPGTALLLGSLHSIMRPKKEPIPGVPEHGRHDWLRRAEGIVWPLVVLAYLLMGFLFDLWHPGWVIFPIVGMLDGIVNTIVHNISD